MAGKQEEYYSQTDSNLGLKVRDVEERQRILRDQIRLIGQNLIDMKEKNNKNIIEIKKNIEIINQNIERLTSFLEMASNEFGKFARKEELEILSKQAKMFQPLNLIKKSSRK
jgi:hypothetical protein